MQNILINFGDGIRIFCNKDEILKLIFNVNTDNETIEVITLNRLKNIKVIKGCIDE